MIPRIPFWRNISKCMGGGVIATSSQSKSHGEQSKDLRLLNTAVIYCDSILTVCYPSRPTWPFARSGRSRAGLNGNQKPRSGRSSPTD